MKKLFIFAALVSCLFTMDSNCAVVYFSVKNYMGRGDNPFLNSTNIDNAYLEDFETQGSTSSNAMTTPNATGWNGASTGSPNWGVQEDYSSKPGVDNLGWTWSDAASVEGWQKPPTGIHFDFAPDEKGRYPEYVGAALRGFGILGSSPSFNSIFVYDASGQEVTGGDWLIPKPPWNPDQPIEDLFLDFEGIYVPGGISSIQFRDFSEVDHLTYGYAPLPEPGTIPLAGLATTMLLLRRRSRG
jgi:hypothetical protein